MCVKKIAAAPAILVLLFYVPFLYVLFMRAFCAAGWICCRV